MHNKPGMHTPPSLWTRITAVWYRHFRVYTRHLITNGLPPFLEPLIFLAGLGLGLSSRIGLIEGTAFIEYLAVGLLITSAMFTAAFECSYGTFIRMEFDKVYDGMLGTPIRVRDLISGEILWAGSKGFFFSLCVLLVLSVFGVVPLGRDGLWLPLLTPFVGFATGLMFGSLSLLVTSFVNTINHFNFYMTGFISPMFFFSGVFFPVENLPGAIQPVSNALPLTHVVRIVRALFGGESTQVALVSLAYVLLFIVIIGQLAIWRLGKRFLD